MSGYIGLSYIGFGVDTSATRAKQAAWYVDPNNGSDTKNDGSSSTKALATLTELANRIDNIELQQDTTINLADGISDCPSSFRLRAGKKKVTFQGGSATPLYTGTATSRTNIARGTNTPPDVTDTALAASNSWTALVARGTRLRTASAVAWPTKDLGSKKARISNPITIPTNYNQAYYSNTATTLATNDAFTIEKLATIDKLCVDVYVYEDFAFTPTVTVRDLNCTNGLFVKTSGVYSSKVAAYFCDVGNANIDGEVVLVGCRLGDAASGLLFTVQPRTQLQLYGGATFGGLSLFGGRCLADLGFIVQGKGVRFNGPCDAILADVGSFDVTGAGFDVNSQPSNPQIANLGSLAWWGSGNSTYGVTTDDGVNLAFSSLAGCTVTGTTNDVGLGPKGSRTGKTWAQIASAGIVSDIATGFGTKISGVVVQ